MSHGKNKKNFQLYTAEEFIAAITQHIPEKLFKMVRDYGWYSNNSRGLLKKQGISHQTINRFMKLMKPSRY